MRALVRKDLRLLRRSPLLVGLLVLYPVVVSVLLGLALSRGPEKPRVAIVNELQPGAAAFALGGRQVDPTSYARRLYEVVEPVRAATREEALRLVREGDVDGALIVPADVTQRLEQAIALGGGPPPTLEVAYATDDPLRAQVVEALIASRLAQANDALSDELVKAAGGYLGILLRGGSFRLLGQSLEVVGLQRTIELVRRAERELPAASPAREDLERVARFAELAVDNLDLSDEVLGAIGTPIRVQRTRIGGAAPPLEAFAVAVAVALSLCSICVLLGAALLALEREEGVLPRLLRGLVGPSRLLAAKVVPAALCGAAATAIMLGVLAPLVDLDPARAPLWAAALAVGALAFAALGVALGALAREVRAASLLAILVVLPVALLALVPEGATGGVVAAAVGAVGAVVPFDPVLRALDAALNGGAPAGPLLHAALLALAWLAVARVALRRLQAP